MSRTRYTPDQFKDYCSVKPPNAVFWYMLTLIGALSIGLATVIISQPLRGGSGAADARIQLVTNVLIGVIFVVPVFSGFLWWRRMSGFTSKKERALESVFGKLNFITDTKPEIQSWPVVPSSIIHNLGARNSSQIPSYYRFNGRFESNPAECVFLDARHFPSPTKSALIYVHIALRDSFPHTIVDGKDGLFRHDLHTRAGDIERLSFEGELHKYFDVFTAAKSGSDALYVFTPDILQHVLDYGVGFNIEVIGNSLYIFARPKLFETPNGFASLMNLASYLTREFNQRSRNAGGSKFRFDPAVSERRMDMKTLQAPT